MNINIPDKSQYSSLGNLWKEAFGDSDDFLHLFFSTAFAPDRCRCVTINGDMAAALYWFDCSYNDKKIAYLYAVATANAFRGQGLCHALMENTHRHLLSLGYAGVILVPGNSGLFPFYAKMGYQICSHVSKFSCAASENEVALWQITKEEYTKLRRKFLPEHSVIQEKENLDFLETQAKFYAGSGFLLAAHSEGCVLYGTELLGSTLHAEDIVHSLGCSNGIFRTPGDEIPFAMYHSLTNSDALPPAYFGLPFD